MYSQPVKHSDLTEMNQTQTSLKLELMNEFAALSPASPSPLSSYSLRRLFLCRKQQKKSVCVIQTLMVAAGWFVSFFYCLQFLLRSYYFASTLYQDLKHYNNMKL